MKIVVYTLGCKVNQCESQSMIKQLLDLGHEVSDEIVDADAYIINTCAVTSEAERKSRQIFSRIRKLSQSSKIIICGCSSQNQPERFVDENTLVIGTSNKVNVVKMLQEKGILIKELPKEFEDFDGIIPTKTRAFVKVQDGCNNFCSYCIIPHLRGRSRSRTIKSIIKEISSLENEKEIVLTGINLSDYGANLGLTLVDLVKSLYNCDKRIRLGSLEVRVITEELLCALKGLKDFCPQFHLSLQSGCNATLKKMNRHYTTDEFLEKTELIRKHFPDCAITTDVIVGFPTETEEDFLQSVEFCKQARFSDIHVFPYSLRTGTIAGSMKQLEKSVIKKRATILNAVKQELHKEFLLSNIGDVVEVLFEQFSEDKKYAEGHTGNYIKVYVSAEPSLLNNIKGVELRELFLDGIKGELK